MSDEILDNEEGEIVRQPYFTGLEGVITISHFVLIIISLQNAFGYGFSIESSMEEIFLIALSSISIFYTYQCRQQTIRQKRIFQIRSFTILRILSAFNALLLLVVTLLALPTFIDEMPKKSTDSEDLFGIFLLLLFLILGICQLFYVKIIHKHLLALQ